MASRPSPKPLSLGGQRAKESPHPACGTLSLGGEKGKTAHYGIRLPHNRPIQHTIAEIMLDIGPSLPYYRVVEGLNSPGVGNADSPGGRGAGGRA